MVSTDMLSRALDLSGAIVAWRRELHAHPELGFQEHWTSAFIARQLCEMGLDVRTGVARTGVVATLGSGSPVIGLRADMDALPIHEANDVPYRSQNLGVMHACGHDANSAILLGCARLLGEMGERPGGTIRFLFQPSEERQDEEGKGGAQRLIEEGAGDGLNALIGVHVDSTSDRGVVDIADGYVMAAADSFDAVIVGEGTHGAYPHLGTDPIYVAATVIQAIQSIVARRTNPLEPAVITVGSIHGGEASNVIPERVTLSGTIRSYDADVRRMLWEELENAMRIAQVLGGDYELAIHEGFPATYNDPLVAGVIRQAAVDLLGADGLQALAPGLGAEDMALFAQRVPSALFMIGARRGDDFRPPHSARFDIDEAALPPAAAVMAESACRLLRLLGDTKHEPDYRRVAV